MINYTAFENKKILTEGNLNEVATIVFHRLKENKSANILIFSDQSGRIIDLGFSGTERQMLERLKIYCHQEIQSYPGAGRPRLGVVTREISLLPKHWEWLLGQDGGASACLRKLIDEKMSESELPKKAIMFAQEKTYKFLHAIAGDLPNFENAIRYLYRKDQSSFLKQISDWPDDVQTYALKLSKIVFETKN